MEKLHVLMPERREVISVESNSSIDKCLKTFFDNILFYFHPSLMFEGAAMPQC